MTNSIRNETISQIVVLYRAQQNLSQEDFAMSLVENLPEQSLTKAAISFWEKGKRIPNYKLCLKLLLRYERSDWRVQFAYDILAATLSGKHEPTGAIGREILGILSTPSIAHNE